MRKLAVLLGLVISLAVAFGAASCGGGDEPALSPTASPTPAGEDLQLSSSAFQEGEPIPVEYTCDGDDVSVPLAWSEPPPAIRSFALILDDPDAPGGVFTHWVLFNVSPETRQLAEGQLPGGALQGKNDFGGIGYGGPCPPGGRTHRYQFTLYALDRSLNLDAGASKRQVLDAMQGHVLARGDLMGTYRS